LLRQIAQEDLDWNNLGPIVSQLRESVAEQVRLDSRKLSRTEDFFSTTADADIPQAPPQANAGVGESPNRPGPVGREGRGPGGSNALKQFAVQRREYLLNHPEIARKP
jgi:hypothetical protein